MTETAKAPRLKSITAPTGTFPVEITVRDARGAEGVITFDCIARTQTAWSRERDSLFAQAQAQRKERASDNEDKTATGDKEGVAPEPELETAQLEKLVSGRLKLDADIVLRIAKGWDLDNDFNTDSFAALEDAYAGAIIDLVNEYSKKIHGNRLGN